MIHGYRDPKAMADATKGICSNSSKHCFCCKCSQEISHLRENENPKWYEHLWGKEPPHFMKKRKAAIQEPNASIQSSPSNSAQINSAQIEAPPGLEAFIKAEIEDKVKESALGTYMLVFC